MKCRNLTIDGPTLLFNLWTGRQIPGPPEATAPQPMAPAALTSLVAPEPVAPPEATAPQPMAPAALTSLVAPEPVAPPEATAPQPMAPAALTSLVAPEPIAPAALTSLVPLKRVTPPEPRMSPVPPPLRLPSRACFSDPIESNVDKSQDATVTSGKAKRIGQRFRNSACARGFMMISLRGVYRKGLSDKGLGGWC